MMILAFMCLELVCSTARRQRPLFRIASRPQTRYKLRIVFEHRHQAVLPRKLFYLRLARHAAVSLAIIGGSLGVGILGYHFAEGLSWLDSLLNASMILSGMGPVNELKHDAGKWFASFYALFSGVMFITTCGILFAPVVHRFLHKFHAEMDSRSR